MLSRDLETLIDREDLDLIMYDCTAKQSDQPCSAFGGGGGGGYFTALSVSKTT